MIQFNLLPDVKQQYIRAQRLKRLAVGLSFITGAAALFIFLVLLSSVYVIQKKNIHDLTSDIQTNAKTLGDTPNIADILTVQSQLNTLSTLNPQKPAASRLFGYLSQITPQKATISDLKVDYAQHSLNITGNAPDLDTVNTFVDGLKFTTYSLKGQASAQSAFSTIVLSSFTRSAKSATYTITCNFDPAIFNNANAGDLHVGSQSQASAQQPSIIFKKSE